MIGYVTLGVANLQDAKNFYAPIMELLGGAIMMETDRMAIWSGPNGGASLSVCLPIDGEVATAGNGTMFALTASDKEQVDAIYKMALELGGSCEGKPGQREMLYAAYFRDPFGNKLNAFCY